MKGSDSTRESFFNVDWDAEFEDEVTDEEKELLTKVATRIVELNMVAPAIMALYPMRPLNFLSSQALLFLEPFTAHVLGFKQMITFRRALSKRETIGILCDEIERLASGDEKPKGPPLLKKLSMDIKALLIERFRKNK